MEELLVEGKILPKPTNILERIKMCCFNPTTIFMPTAFEYHAGKIVDAGLRDFIEANRGKKFKIMIKTED